MTPTAPRCASLFASGILLLPLFAAGCGDSARGDVPGNPTAPSPPTTSAPPTISAIAPLTGSIDGSTPVRITGTGFHRDAAVTIGAPVAWRSADPRDADRVVAVRTTAHVAATVDVVVTNPDGQSARLPGAYTYVPATSFDFNGRWSAYGNAGQDIPIEFTIENELVVNAWCDTQSIVFSPPLRVLNGAFSFIGAADRVLFSGRIVSRGAAVGMMHFGPCTDTVWFGQLYSVPPGG